VEGNSLYNAERNSPAQNVIKTFSVFLHLEYENRLSVISLLHFAKINTVKYIIITGRFKFQNKKPLYSVEFFNAELSGTEHSEAEVIGRYTAEMSSALRQAVPR